MTCLHNKHKFLYFCNYAYDECVVRKKTHIYKNRNNFLRFALDNISYECCCELLFNALPVI